ncbi:MAG TPA: hypothetical protein DCY32_07725 [Opitutae bacterium]|nr:hypothetical protein [Opitutae bacterium]
MHQEGGQRERGGVPLFVLSSKKPFTGRLAIFDILEIYEKNHAYPTPPALMVWISLIRRIHEGLVVIGKGLG